MFTTISIYFLMLFIIIWSYCGYLIFLLIFNTLNRKKVKEHLSDADLPRLAIIVPCFNEQETALSKIENLKSLQYNFEKLQVFFANGSSTDATSEIVSQQIQGMKNWFLLETKCCGKIHQLNSCLSAIKEQADIIVITDVDAALEPETLIHIVDEFSSDPKTAVVGANISPKDSIPIEESYWQDQNFMRIIESNVYTASIVVAPCYAFRSWLIDTFPDDCIADDIYIAFKANTDGYRTKYINAITGIECRTPSTSEGFFQHKFRKGNAYLIELFRFFYRLPYMSAFWKMMFLTKFLQLVVIPWLLPYFVLSTISLALSRGGLLQVAVLGMITIFSSFLVTSIMMGIGRKKLMNGTGKSRRSLFLPFFISNFILITVGLSFPFYKQTSNYEKIGK